MDTFAVMWGTEQTNILLVPSFPCWERGRARGRVRGTREEKRREEKGREGREEKKREERVGVLVGCGVWSDREGKVGRREKGTEGESQRAGEDRDRETARPTNKDEILISPLRRGNCDDYEIIILSSHKFLIVMLLIHHIADYGLIDHWSFNNYSVIKKISILYWLFVHGSISDESTLDCHPSNAHWSYGCIDHLWIGRYWSIVRSLAMIDYKIR